MQLGHGPMPVVHLLATMSSSLGHELLVCMLVICRGGQHLLPKDTGEPQIGSRVRHSQSSEGRVQYRGYQSLVWLREVPSWNGPTRCVDVADQDSYRCPHGVDKPALERDKVLGSDA